MERRHKLIMAAFVAAGLAFFVAAGMIGNSGNSDVSVVNNPAIDALIPNRGDEVLQQQQVGIDLATDFRLVQLTISPDAKCGSPVDVTNQTRHVEGLQQYVFSPGEGLPIERLSADFNCAVATFEEIARPGDFEQIEWTFTVN